MRISLYVPGLARFKVNTQKEPGTFALAAIGWLAAWASGLMSRKPLTEAPATSAPAAVPDKPRTATDLTDRLTDAGLHEECFAALRAAFDAYEDDLSVAELLTAGRPELRDSPALHDTISRARVLALHTFASHVVG